MRQTPSEKKRGQFQQVMTTVLPCVQAPRVEPTEGLPWAMEAARSRSRTPPRAPSGTGGHFSMEEINHPAGRRLKDETIETTKKQPCIQNKIDKLERNNRASQMRTFIRAHGVPGTAPRDHPKRSTSTHCNMRWSVTAQSKRAKNTFKEPMIQR